MASRPLRLVVTGRNGQVVRALNELAGSAGNSGGVSVITIGRPDFDLAATGDVAAQIAALAPDVIVNAGAYTAVDKAETDRELAFAINAQGAGRVARAASRLGVPVIQISTDYVFDGSSRAPYREDDATNPVNYYGATKLEGERLVREATPNHAILRTSWVYSPFGQNFVLTMLRIGRANEQIRVVADQHGSPTSAFDIADSIIRIARALIERPDESALWGTFHMTNAGVTTWAGFAEEVLRLAAERGGSFARVIPIPTSEYVTPAKRPVSSRLNTAKLANIYGIASPSWTSALRIVMDRVANLQPI